MFPELAQLWRFRSQSHLGCARTTISQIQSMDDTSNRSCRVDVSNSPVSKAVSSPHCAPFTGLCAKRTGAVEHCQSLLLPHGPLF